jgi:hypothetical protein
VPVRRRVGPPVVLYSNILFESDGREFEIIFDKRKKNQFRQGNKVYVASSLLATACHVRLLWELQSSTGGAVDMHVFREFNDRLVTKNPRATAPGPNKITYDQFHRFLSL